MNLSGKIAIVTGGGKGIGEAVALRFAKEGAAVTVGDADEAAGSAVVERIKSSGGRAQFFHGDLTILKNVQDMLEATVSAFGGLDYAVNNVGGAVKGAMPPIHAIDLDALEADMRLNLYATIFATRVEVDYLLANKRKGSIVNVSSLAGLGGSITNPGYAISKHGVLGLTRHAAIAYGPSGIRVNAICPGSVRTPLLLTNFGGHEGMEEMMASATSLKRIGSPDEIANLAIWLCSDESAFMTGAVIPIDGGQSASVVSIGAKRRDE